MLKRLINILLNKLGYLPKEEIKVYQDEIQKYRDTISISKKNMDSHFKSFKDTLEEVNNKSRVAHKNLKESRRKQTVLLKKNHKLKNEMTLLNISKSSLEKSLNQANRKVIWLEAYNSAILHKLEQICFGSTLPRAMKQSNLDYYLYPEKRIKYIMQNYLNTCTLHAIIKE